MDIGLLVHRLKSVKNFNPPTSLDLKAAEAIEKLAQRIDADQQVIANLQYQINNLLQKDEELLRKDNSTTPTSPET